MRTRKEISKYVYEADTIYKPIQAITERREAVILEVLLDIRELLIIHTPEQRLRKLK